MHDALIAVILFVAGAVISMLGSMTGLGGGFLCVPFLVLVWARDRSNAVLISLTMIIANSLSSSITYLRAKMVNLKVFAVLLAPTLPGLFLGLYLLNRMNDAVFDLIFSILLILVTSYILFKNIKQRAPIAERLAARKRKGSLLPQYSIPIAFAAGTASSAFGIGGGALLMPLQVGMLKMNVKRAIATSMLLLACMATFRVFVISMAVSGNYPDPLYAIPLAAGAVLGGQAGAFIVKRAKSKYLLYILAVFLFFIAIYMFAGAVPRL
ncbi:MAG: sulfite exporter TauE/SafE family protein [Thermoplasmatota archaeon]